MKYDITLKSLLMGGAPALMTHLAGTSRVSLAPAELPAVVSRTVDLIGDLPDDRLLHAEVQSGNDSLMPCRMLGYYWMILESNPRADIVQVVLYIGSGPLRMADGLSLTGLSLRYRVIDARSLDPKPLLESDSPGDIVASFLCRADDIGQRVREILDRLRDWQGRDPQVFNDAIAHLVLLGGLRDAGRIIEREVLDMPVRIDIEQNPILKGLYDRGLVEGKAEGKAESLLHLMRRRFGSVPEEIAARVITASSAELDVWLDNILDAASPEAVLTLPKAN
jgi:hypothetical protein